MPYDAAAKIEAKAFVAKLRAATVCADCGAQPTEWHHRDEADQDRHYNRAISRLASLGFPLHAIEAEIAKCDPLCRACHMRRDGRAAALTEARPFKKGDTQPPKPCEECGVLTNPLRRGKCRRCYDRERRS